MNTSGQSRRNTSFNRPELTTPSVSVIVVTYNSIAYIEDLARSIQAQRYQGPIELVVVDNASSDETLSVLRATSPDAVVVAMKQNVGYRKGNRIGIEAASGDYFLLCNDDAVMEPDCIDQLISYAQNHASVGLLAPLILDHATSMVNTAGNCLSISGFYSAHAKGRPAQEFSQPVPIASVSGCCFLYPRWLYRELGGFSEDFDLHPSAWHASYEDVDLSWRVRMAGFEICLLPSAVVRHKYRQKPELSLERFQSMLIGRLLLVARQFQVLTILLLLPYLVVVEGCLLSYAAFRGWKFLKGYVDVWIHFLCHAITVLRMRREQQVNRVVGDARLFDQVRELVEVTPILRSSPLLDYGYRALQTWSLAYLKILSFAWNMRSSRRPFDISIAAIGLVVGAPVMIIIGLLVRLLNGRPVLHRDLRAGMHGRPFTLVKFRTMNDARDPSGQLLPDSRRLTKLGQLIRSTSLDELPQLWNVFKGEMSVVGPRPLPVKYLPRYSSRQAVRHRCRPGITGWAQVHGRNSLTWTQKLEFDVWYVENQSFWLDLQILALTVLRVLRRVDVNQPGHATAAEFLGNEGRMTSQ